MLVHLLLTVRLILLKLLESKEKAEDGKMQRVNNARKYVLSTQDANT